MINSSVMVVGEHEQPELLTSSYKIFGIKSIPKASFESIRDSKQLVTKFDGVPTTKSLAPPL